MKLYKPIGDKFMTHFSFSSVVNNSKFQCEAAVDFNQLAVKLCTKQNLSQSAAIIDF